jgi:uncharacterized membrane protein
MGNYSKAIAAGIGLAAIVLKDVFQIEIGQPTVDKIVEGVMALMTVVGVVSVSNQSK